MRPPFKYKAHFLEPETAWDPGGGSRRCFTSSQKSRGARVWWSPHFQLLLPRYMAGLRGLDLSIWALALKTSYFGDINRGTVLSIKLRIYIDFKTHFSWRIYQVHGFPKTAAGSLTAAPSTGGVPCQTKQEFGSTLCSIYLISQTYFWHVFHTLRFSNSSDEIVDYRRLEV